MAVNFLWFCIIFFCIYLSLLCLLKGERPYNETEIGDLYIIKMIKKIMRKKKKVRAEKSYYEQASLCVMALKSKTISSIFLFLFYFIIIFVYFLDEFCVLRSLLSFLTQTWFGCCPRSETTEDALSLGRAHSCCCCSLGALTWTSVHCQRIVVCTKFLPERVSHQLIKSLTFQQLTMAFLIKLKLFSLQDSSDDLSHCSLLSEM